MAAIVMCVRSAASARAVIAVSTGAVAAALALVAAAVTAESARLEACASSHFSFGLVPGGRPSPRRARIIPSACPTFAAYPPLPCDTSPPELPTPAHWLVKRRRTPWKPDPSAKGQLQLYGSQCD